MFVTAEFASDATWTATGGAPVAGRLIVDSASAELLEQVTARDISAIYETVVWPTVGDRDRIAIGAEQFLVMRVEKLADGKVARLHLRRA